MNLYEELREALRKEIQKHSLSGQNISVRYKALSPTEAIGKPEHDDYPIIKGKEVMVEAVFNGAKGQAFTDEFENADYFVDDLLKIELNSNKRRASFISGLNAVFRYLNLCDKTIHCKDTEPKECANNLSEAIGPRNNVLLVGHQPRFLEMLASQYNIRVVDLDQDNIGSDVFGVVIEPPEMTPDAIKWCDLIFATGSTVVNGTITNFLNQDKPALFYGVTISAAANILDLKTYCHCGH
ncbi:MAG: hypothetical protein JRJ11_12575 [Deltaproteobacteria bacterium]|nr:hypothetical protein [Deltaproteobacteria bacterium]MBW1910357.1 hypothetical protein [Deltaproteobacteria bacterium]MBW2034794.1 hypothetical protein [Deltaproteobacteria bacterium]MBW2115052.1 hypothetical protein [Deltaproteobacteria bacterium]MBW2168690.1 hypothetical protein [Deltaproteobacteria bacterium]